MDDIITHLLSQIQVYSRQIEKQRREKELRGETFNIFNELGLMSDEVRLHSTFLAMLLNPNGHHGQGDKFLKEFVKILYSVDRYKSIPSNFLLEADRTTIQCEKSIGIKTESDGGRIDLYITDNTHCIIIENKIYSDDQPQQMLRYRNYAKNVGKPYVLIYLTLYGVEPSKESLAWMDKKEIICLSYKYEIKTWLERCVELTARQPLLRETINQYINTIDILTNNTMDTNKDMLNILKKKENIEATFAIINSKESLVNNIMKEYFLPRIKDLARGKGFQMECNVDDWVNTSWAGACFYSEKWKYFYLAFEFDKKGLGELIFGFHLKDKNYKRSDVKDWEKLQDSYSQTEGKDNQGWIFKDFEGERMWLSASVMKDLMYGDNILNVFDKMFDDAIKSAEGLDV